MMSQRLNRKITLQYPTTSQDSYGEEDVTWATYRNVWAQVVQQSGREIFSAGIVAEADTLFRMRYISTLDETWRISYNSKYYNIKSVKELGRKEGLEVTAKAQT